MEYQFLQEAPEPRGPRLGPTEWQLVSAALHLLVFFLIFYVPAHLPPRLRALLEPAPPPAVPVAVAGEHPLVQPPRPQTKLRQPPAPKIPLGFAYVKVPNDTASPQRNPDAPLMSDKNRQARQEVPTPPEVRKFSIDPHSAGNTETRVRPDPRLAEGPESPETPHPSAQEGAKDGDLAGRSSAAEAEQQGSQGRESGNPRASGGRGAGSGPSVGEEGPGGLLRPGGGDGSPGTRRPGKGSFPSAEARARVQQILSEARASENKDTFVNPGYLPSGNYASMSFDTQDFPWGDYQRRVYMAIRNNWLARIPLAARNGMRDYVCWRFFIEKDGSVSGLQSIRSSPVAPLDRAADDAIQASSRLPPLPADFPQAREGTTWCFFYNMLPSEAE